MRKSKKDLVTFCIRPLEFVEKFARETFYKVYKTKVVQASIKENRVEKT